MTDSFADLIRRAQRTLLGTWVKMPTTLSVELLALAGFDFVVIDMEHAPLSIQCVHELLGAARAHQMPALVRVPDGRPSTISRVLDSGALGVLVPHIDSVTDAASAIAAARFPPHGTRGFGPTVRSGQWGGDIAGYRASADTAFVATQLESRDAIEAAQSIAGLDGLGALFVGPVDLAVASRLEPESAEFQGMISAAETAASRAGVPIGTAVGADTAMVRRLIDRYDFVLVSNDASLLRSAGAALIGAIRETDDLRPINACNAAPVESQPVATPPRPPAR